MMTTEQVGVLFDEKIVKKLGEKTFVEIATRDKRGRFQSFIKCSLMDLSMNKDNNDCLINALAVIKEKNAGVNKRTASMNCVTNTLRNLEKQLNCLPNAVRNLSTEVNSICDGMKFIKSMSFLNVGLSSIDLMVNVAGFCYMVGKLQEIDKELQSMDRKLDDLKNISKNELLAKYHRFTIETARIADKEKHQEVISLAERENLLDEMNEYLFKVIMDINDNALEMSVLSEIVYSLIVPYSKLIGEYVREYWLLHKEVPSTLHSYKDPFEKLLSQKYSDRMFNHWYFEQGETNRDVVTAIEAQKLLVLKCLTYIQDRIDLVTALDTEEDLAMYEEIIDKSVKEEVSASLQEALTALNTDEEEREKIMSAVMRAEAEYRI